MSDDVADGLLSEPGRSDVVDWLTARGYLRDHGSIGITWSDRLGFEYVTLGFWPTKRNADDVAWLAFIEHHASGTHPRAQIGLCETLADVQRTHDAIRLINGYREPEPERSSDWREQFKRGSIGVKGFDLFDTSEPTG